MEDNDKNLEQFFNKKFAQNIDAEPWNTPPDDLWTGIEQDIVRQKGREKRRGLLVPLLFCSLLLGGAGYFYCQMKSYESRLKELEIRLEACGSDVDRAISLNKNTEPSNLGITAPVLSDEKKENRFKKSSVSNDKEYVGPQQQFVSPSMDPEKGIDTKNFDPSMDQPMPGNDPATTTADILVSKKLGPIQTIGQRTMIGFLKSPVRLVRYFDEKPIDLDKNGPSKLLQIGLATETLFWQDRINGKLDVPLSELLIKESVSNTFSYGLLVKKGISRHWSLDAGLFYGNRQTLSTYLLKIPYTIATEHSNPDGSIDNEFSHSLPSGLGNINTFLVVNREAGSTVVNNEDIVLDFAYRLNSRSLFVPLKFTFYPRIVGKGLFAALGINNQFDFSDKLEIVQAKSLHNTVHEKSIDVSLGNDRQRKYSLNAAVNLGYQLPINARTSGILTVGYDRALTNKFAVNGFSHKIDHWAIGLSINRSF